jgi:glycosyltransferase involved in cell wall biosynthesis
MNPITFVIPSRNNLEFLQLAYKSIRNLKTRHEILILDDASHDGTQDWIASLNDKDLITYHNPGPERIGIVGMFDKGIEMARTKIIFAFHADMVASPHLDVNILKHLKPGTVVCATRIEPPLHPPGPEKITLDWGSEVEDYNYNDSEKYFLELETIHRDKTTEGIFAPWCMFKEDYLAIGGHDELFAPQSKEDSDLFNRFILNGYKVIQSWDGLVYHFTSRGSRFNKHVGGKAGQNSTEWEMQNIRSARNFIRKWGHFVKHDRYMKPIVVPKYNIAIVLSMNPSLQLIYDLEPWCDRIYIDEVLPEMSYEYRDMEQKNTAFDLAKRVLNKFDNDPEAENDIVVYIDKSKFGQEQFQALIQLPEIIEEQIVEVPEPLTFDLVGMKVVVQNNATYENELIKINTQYNTK